MKEDKIKMIFDKIIIGIFYILCVVAFFMVVVDLPYSICAIIGYNEYDGGWEITSFFVCCALLGYVVKYYEEKQNDEFYKINTKHIEELTALENFYKLNNFKGTFITKIVLTEFRKIEILILNKYNVTFELYLFSNIKTEEDFLKLDSYIAEYVKQNPYNLGSEYKGKEIIYSSHLESFIEEYLKTNKN